MESWETYINMEQKTFDEKKKPTFSQECMDKTWTAFMNPIIFGKVGERFENLPDFKGFFRLLSYIEANVAGSKSNTVFNNMMGQTWSPKIHKVTAKKTSAKLKIHVKKAGADIAAGAKKVGDFFKKAGKSVANGVKKAAASLKGGLKVNLKAPKAKVSLKAGA